MLGMHVYDTFISRLMGANGCLYSYVEENEYTPSSIYEHIERPYLAFDS